MKQIKGQISIFDFDSLYKWNRYIGQEVVFWRSGIHGKIIEIERYYTLVKSGKDILVGTPNEISPA